MTCYIVASELSCGLGRDMDRCLSQLKLACLGEAEIKPAVLNLDTLEDPVAAPYFPIPNTSELSAHELMYEITRQNLESVIKKSGFSAEQLSRTGLFWGSSSFTVSDSEYQYFEALGRGEDNALPMPIVGYNKLPESLALDFGLSDCVHSYATACTSSANALLYADAFIHRGEIDHAIIVGSEFYNAVTLLGFYGLELLSQSGAMRPFDLKRDGLILGEACAALLVSGSVHSSMKFLAGAGNTDSFSLTAANTDGSTIAAVMKNALAKAGKQPQQVRAMKVHGTASLSNDEAEAAGILDVFAGRGTPSLFALKPYIGHTLGGCGAAELALIDAALKAGFLPASPGVASSKESLGVSLQQEISGEINGLYVLNYFAFGGNNCSLVFEYES